MRESGAGAHRGREGLATKIGYGESHDIMNMFSIVVAQNVMGSFVCCSVRDRSKHVQ